MVKLGFEEALLRKRLLEHRDDTSLRFLFACPANKRRKLVLMPDFASYDDAGLISRE